MQEITRSFVQKGKYVIDHIWKNLQLHQCEVHVLDAYWINHDIVHDLLHFLWLKVKFPLSLRFISYKKVLWFMVFNSFYDSNMFFFLFSTLFICFYNILSLLQHHEKIFSIHTRKICITNRLQKVNVAHNIFMSFPPSILY